MDPLTLIFSIIGAVTGVGILIGVLFLALIAVGIV
jgi:hypothetical protein